MSVFVLKDGITVELSPGAPRSLAVLPTIKRLGYDHGIHQTIKTLGNQGSSETSGAIFHKPEDNSEKLERYRNLSLKDAYGIAYLSLGVHPEDGGCNLKCSYCSNWFGHPGRPLEGVFPPKKSGPVEDWIKLIKWISQTSRYWINWDIGEPLHKTGLVFLKALGALTIQEKARCNNVLLHTNGLHLLRNHFPEDAFAGFACRRELRWTVNLIDAGPGAHLSVESHFDNLCVIASHASKADCIRTLLVFLPTDCDLRKLPGELLRKLESVIKLFKPHSVVPDHIWHMESDDAFALNHSTYYPNVHTFAEWLYDRDLLPDEQWPTANYLVDEFNNGLPNTQRPTLYVGNGQFIMPDERLLDIDDIKGEYGDYLKAPLPIEGRYIERCATCVGFSTCPVVGRPDFPAMVDLSKRANAEEAFHAQLRDQGLWSTYVFSMLVAKHVHKKLNESNLQRAGSQSVGTIGDQGWGNALPSLHAQKVGVHVRLGEASP